VVTDRSTGAIAPPTTHEHEPPPIEAERLGRIGRSTTLDGTCDKHQFERSVDLCHSCGKEFCGECLVFPFGDGKAPYCIHCALAISGVRTNAARAPKLSRRELRRRAKEREQAVQARLAAVSAPEISLDEPDGALDLDWSVTLPPPPGSPVPGWAEPAPTTPPTGGSRMPF
jgi:hypothetical protein